MRILVCGGRHYDNYEKVRNILLEYMGRVDEENMLGTLRPIIISGGASGADSLAVDVAVCYWLQFEVYKADWKTHGRAAGPIRNQQMIDEGKPDLCIAFPGGAGTADMIRKCKKAGIPVREVSE